MLGIMVDFVKTQVNERLDSPHESYFHESFLRNSLLATYW
ncbi:hypothetical protein Lepto7375DRAFT_1569 [Leptolyngbya sp. PCC 7375]|nr:hypothetical protein Lepto7375DRAFT_1569 [Leptolyngbya sp. PCC 7375]